MVGLNKVMIIGNVGTDPEMRYTANGSAVTTFRIACNRNYSTPDGERREETEWFNVVTWNKLAETCSQFLQKGRRAYVEGRLQTRSWEGQDGQRRFRTEVVATTVLFLDRAQATPVPEEMLATSGAGAGGGGGGGDTGVEPDEIPFDQP
jgi:single-strand DNA-binding protein